MSISEEFPNAFTADGTEYRTTPGAVNPVGDLNVFLKVGYSDYLDHLGELHEEPTPEGCQKADLLLWNATKDTLLEYVKGLPDEGIFKIAGVTNYRRTS